MTKSEYTKSDKDWTKTELDGKYKWICDNPQCNFVSTIMYDADTHQVQTEHSMTRCKIL